MHLRLPVGYDNFYDIIHQRFHFVDKSLLISEILDDPSQVMVITRPRRFGKTLNWYNVFLNHLLSGDLEAFQRDLTEVMASIVSSHDLSRDPEAFYHGLMIGLTASLYQHPNYEIHFNRESGYGRYDYMIFSRDLNQPTLLLEFKRVNKNKDSEQLAAQLEQAAQTALTQITQKKYAAEAQQRGSQKWLKIGIAFSGKHFALRWELDTPLMRDLIPA